MPIIAKNTRLDIRTTIEAKAILEYATNALGTTLSAFVLDAAMAKARSIMAQLDIIHLTQNESERFIAALNNPPKANERLKQLFKKYQPQQDLEKT